MNAFCPRPYRDLVERLADLEPKDSWSEATQLPMLMLPDVTIVLANRGQDVIDFLHFEPDELELALTSSSSLALLGVRMTVALEQAARRVLWLDVSDECERRAEARERDRDDPKSVRRRLHELCI